MLNLWYENDNDLKYLERKIEVLMIK